MHPYQTYYNPQMMYNPVISAQQRLAQMEQQYPQYGQQNNIFTMQMSAQMLSGRIVDDFASINANDVPMDNTGAIFAKRDGSEIQHKIWGVDGIIKTTSYKPISDEKILRADILSNDEEKLKFDLSDEATEGIMSRFDDIAVRIERLEKSINGKSTAKSKKESEPE